VFLKAYRAYGSYDQRYALSTWLYSITRNTLIDHYRKQRDVVDIDDLPLSDTEDELYRLVTADLSEADVRTAVDRLPSPQRDIIQRQFFQGQTAKEVGEALGLSHAATRKHVSRALATLRQTLLTVVFISYEIINTII
jgi:RNA polymerase sigma-70 factor (ECF subfamily)